MGPDGSGVMSGPGSTLSLIDRVRMRLVADANRPGPSDLDSAARAESALLVDARTLAELSEGLNADLTGAGPLEELLRLDGVTDVLVNAPDQVWLERGSGLQRAAVRFSDDAAIRRLACRLAAQAGRRLDDAAPFVDAALPDGTRLHAMLPPMVAHPTICLRVLSRRRLGMADLVAAGAMSKATAQLLTAVVGARLTLLISGGTGTGKTTLLAALLATAEPMDRIITIEDAAELAIVHPHVLGLVTRSPNIEGSGGVNLRELVRQSLRMRADRLVVGEFRGAEIAELLGALNTGHTGGAATVHANSIPDVPTRLVALGALGGVPAEVLRAQAASAFDLLVHLKRDTAGRRRIDQIALWPRSDGAPPLVWSHLSGVGPGARQLADRIVESGAELPPLLRNLA
jgi:pilus assembly protein CpaF